MLEQSRQLPSGRNSESTNIGREVMMPGARSQDSNLKTKGLALAASLRSNVFNVLKFGSPVWTRFELLPPERDRDRTRGRVLFSK